MRYLFLLAALSALLFPATVHALCVNPPGDKGDQIYNSSHDVMQYCNGSKWISMGGGGGFNLSCAAGQVAGFDGTDWVCAPSASFSGTVQAAAPTANNHLATKSYVDMAVASAAGGSGTTCMYFSTANNAACPAGWAQAGHASSYNTGSNWHRVCCMGGGSLLDEMPTAFDFPASPALASSAGHTWSPVEVTGFDSASVSIQTTANSGTGEFRICSNSTCGNVLKGWGTSPTGIAAGNFLQIRIGAHTSIRAADAKITVMVGGMTDEAPITPQIAGTFFAAFVTSQTWNGILGGIAGADAKCQAAATGAGMSGTFRALVATGSGDAPAARFENVGTTSPFYTPNSSGAEIKIADNWSDLTDGNLDAKFEKTEAGGTASGTAWTNVQATGIHYSSGSALSCTDWGNTSSNSGHHGNIGVTTSSWMNGATGPCSALRSLYCFQTVLP